MIKLTLASRAQIAEMQTTVAQSHYLHRPVDSRCSVEAYSVALDGVSVGLLMFGRPEATRCGNWYGGVDDVIAGRCEVTRWQVLNLARVWFDPIVQPGGSLHESTPGYRDRRGIWRSTLASDAIGLAAQRIGRAYLVRRPPCFLDEPYQIEYLMSYCDRRIHRGTIYRAAGFECYRTNSKQIETWRLRLSPLTPEDDVAVRQASALDSRAQCYRMERERCRLQLCLI